MASDAVTFVSPVDVVCQNPSMPAYNMATESKDISSVMVNIQKPYENLEIHFII